MIRYNKENYCQEAEIYYFEYIEKDTEEIPADILDHLDSCNVCAENMRKLSANLEKMSEKQASLKEKGHNISNFLADQCKYVGKEVKCADAKPFLPLLASPSMKVNALTPITAHIDNCPACKNDLLTVTELELSEKRLKSLSVLLSNRDFETPVGHEYPEKLASFVKLEWQSLTKQELEYFSGSLDCAPLIYNMRQELLEGLEKIEDLDSLHCGSIEMEDLFDYCFPVDIDPENDQYQKFRTVFIQHVVNCPKCLFKMQMLHLMLYDMRTRVNSGIATKFIDAGKIEIAESVSDENISKQEPVAVGGDKTRKNINFNYKLMSKIAVAALILISVGLFITNINTAKALSLGQLYENIARIKNVCIKKFTPDSEKPIEEKIISKELNIYLVKSDQGSSLWDINAKTLVQQKANLPVLVQNLSQDQIENNNNMRGSLGLMPFESLRDIPENARWAELDHNVYELSWTKEQGRGPTDYFKWQVWLDDKDMPYRVEWFIKTEDSNWKMTLRFMITYPDLNEMRTLLKM